MESSLNARVPGTRRWLKNHRRMLAHAHREAVWRLAKVNVALNKAGPCSKASCEEDVRLALRDLERHENKYRRLDEDGVVMLDLSEDMRLTPTGKKWNDELRRRENTPLAMKDRENTPLAIEDSGPCMRAAASARACEGAARGAGEAAAPGAGQAASRGSKSRSRSSAIGRVRDLRPRTPQESRSPRQK